MTKVVVLDTGTLSMATHPSPNKDFADWLKSILTARIEVRVPEICDYELRRELIRTNKAKSILKLDQFNSAVGYIPINTAAMKLAASLWAEMRNQGMQTADDKALDGDVILAAQTAQLENAGFDPVIATDNVAHLSRLSKADNWKNLVVGKNL